MSRQAPANIAEKLVEELQQRCLEEAANSRASFEWEAQLHPARFREATASEKKLLDAIARQVTKRVEGLGLERVDWWTGREWRTLTQAQGRFTVLQEAFSHRYFLKVRVRWRERSAKEPRAPSSMRSSATPSLDEDPRMAADRESPTLHSSRFCEAQRILMKQGAQTRSRHERLAREHGHFLRIADDRSSIRLPWPSLLKSSAGHAQLEQQLLLLRKKGIALSQVCDAASPSLKTRSGMTTVNVEDEVAKETAISDVYPPPSRPSKERLASHRQLTQPVQPNDEEGRKRRLSVGAQLRCDQTAEQPRVRCVSHGYV